MQITVSTGMCKCAVPTAVPTPLVAISNILVGNFPVLTILDCVPMVNVMSFGVCPNGPVPTPCVPVPAGSWIPMKPTVIAGKGPILRMDSMLVCGRGGVIQIIMPGQFTVMAP